MSVRFIASIAILVSVLLAATAPGGGAQSASTVVRADVVGATSLDPDACAPGQPGITDLGALTSGDRVRTNDCVVTFGSSNETAALHLFQTDRVGDAMWQPSVGAPVSTFADAGLAITDGGPGTNDDYGFNVHQQDDGKLLVAGKCDMGAVNDYDACALRYDTDGSLDTSYGSGGRAVIAVTPGANWDDMVTSVMQPDGKLLLAGRCEQDEAAQWDMCVIRLTTTGVLDAAFGDGGVVLLAPSGNRVDYARAIVQQADGRIVLAGQCSFVATGSDFCLVRLQSDGRLDGSYGSGGIVTRSIMPGAGADIIREATIQPDGKVLVVGGCGSTSSYDPCMARFTTAGAPDMSFGTSGAVYEPIGVTSALTGIWGVDLQPDGAIIAGVQCEIGATGSDYCIQRYSDAGVLDTTFGSAGTGTVTTAVGAGTAIDNLRTLLRQPDGKLLAGGYCTMATTGTDLCIVRYHANGLLDTSFDGDGILTRSSGTGSTDDHGRRLTLTADGSIAFAGDCAPGGSGADMCMLLLEGGDTVPQYGASATWLDDNHSHFGACVSSVSVDVDDVWTADAGCPMDDGGGWHAVPATPTPIARTTTATIEGAEVRLRFGMHVSGSTTPGAYVAPITFHVVAPSGM